MTFPFEKLETVASKSWPAGLAMPAVITAADLKDWAAIASYGVSAACAILICRHKLKKKQRKPERRDD